jgi:hypothetical protein
MMCAHSKRPFGRPASGGSKGRLIIVRQRRGWVVKNDDGTGVVAGPFATCDAAHEARSMMKAASKVDRQWRPCLSCGENFQSEGIHNRLCHVCSDHGLPNQYVGV